jgi:hypothetical protein
VTEQWAPIAGWEGRYEISTLGRVRTLDRETLDRLGRRHVVHGRIMATKVNPTQGRVFALLYRCGRLTRLPIHVVVLEAFVGPRPLGMVACHNDGDPQNNALSNLRWDTQGSNNLDAVKHGTHVQARKTHCPAGHPYSGENLAMYLNGGIPRRRCRTCRNVTARARYARRDAA